MEDKLKGAAIGLAAGAGVAVSGIAGVTAAIGLLGFKAGGIAAGSVAAKMMSAAAIANGGGVAAGSTVAVLQSIGAAGFSLATKLGVTSLLGTVGAGVGAMWSNGKPKPKPKSDDNSDSSDDDEPKGDGSSAQPRDRPGETGQLRLRRRSGEQQAAGRVDRNGGSVVCTPGSSPSPNSSQPGQQGDSPCLPTPTRTGVVCLAVDRKIY